MERAKKTGKELADLEQQLHDYSGEDRIVSSTEIAKELEKTEDSVYRLSTGVPTLDRILNGVEAGELVIVTGPTGEGKTTLLMTITQHMAAQKINTVWFTLEVTPRQFINKMMKGDKNKGVPLFFMPNKNTDNQIKWLEERIIEAKVKYNCQVVFIDHLHQIFSLAMMESNRNFSLEIGDLAAKIKDIAIQQNLVIFLIAHCKDDPAGSSREPRKEDIRDSGLIIRIADSILGIWRIPNDDDGTKTRRKEINEHDVRSKVRVFKNRREGTQAAWVMDHQNHMLLEASQMIEGDYAKQDEPF